LPASSLCKEHFEEVEATIMTQDLLLALSVPVMFLLTGLAAWLLAAYETRQFDRRHNRKHAAE
jgi:hypothetical protein